MHFVQRSAKVEILVEVRARKSATAFSRVRLRRHSDKLWARHLRPSGPQKSVCQSVRVELQRSTKG
jgi:hypothetical protein